MLKKDTRLDGLISYLDTSSQQPSERDSPIVVVSYGFCFPFAPFPFYTPSVLLASDPTVRCSACPGDDF